MKSISLDKSDFIPKVVKLPSSKSLSNRYLILQAFLPHLQLIDLAKADDTSSLLNALKSNDSIIDCGHGGTTIRFLTAYYACQPGKQIEIGGSSRLNERPIGPLVEALIELGGEIEYVNQEGYPPLKINGKNIEGGRVILNGSVSSQFISALILIAPFLKNGLEIELQNQVVSASYIDMTIDCITKIGAEAEKREHSIFIKHLKERDLQCKIKIEPDWSAAAFWFSRIALSPEGSKMELPGLELYSSQGDSKVIDFFETLGVRTRFAPQGIVIRKTDSPLPKLLAINLLSHPDLAQPLAVTCAALGVEVSLTGLQTLTIKETNRLSALKIELSNFGIDCEITESSIYIPKQQISSPKRPVKTYNDHRMAMSFSVLSALFDVEIENRDVVTKSYHGFWEQYIS